MVEIRVNDTQVVGALKKVSAKMRDMTPLMKEIGEHMVSSTIENFNQQGRPNRWAPLAQSTMWNKTGGSKAYTKKGTIKKSYQKKFNRQILTDKARLRNSISSDADKKSVTIGTNVVYAAIHQFGGKTAAHLIKPKKGKALAWPDALHPVKVVHHPGSKVPARPFLVMLDSDRSEILRMAGRYLA